MVGDTHMTDVVSQLQYDELETCGHNSTTVHSTLLLKPTVLDQVVTTPS